MTQETCSLYTLTSQWRKKVLPWPLSDHLKPQIQCAYQIQVMMTVILLQNNVQFPLNLHESSSVGIIIFKDRCSYQPTTINKVKQYIKCFQFNVKFTHPAMKISLYLLGETSLKSILTCLDSNLDKYNQNYMKRRAWFD